jgi:hypothetical protein
MNLQERATALMLVENDRVLSRITPRFLALWEEFMSLMSIWHGCMGRTEVGSVRG